MSDAISFCGNPLDRAALARRDPAWIEAQLVDESARYLPMWKLQPLVKLGERRSLAWATSEFFAELDPTPEKILLGIEEGVPHFAADVSGPNEGAEQLLGVEEVARFEELRSIAPQLGADETGIAAQARSLIDWHSGNLWCPACGGSTRARQAGGLRVCGDCLVEHYPRTNPVAIVVVSDGDRCLLGRAPGWPAVLYSALAGFIEPGETIEAAARREVMEEAGIAVGEVSYVTSQPWPFPSSLMIGCLAEATSSEIQVDPIELEHADWFSRDQVRESLSGRSKELVVPPSLALAHHLILEWIAQD
jgi:NAD+ diphosphatase